ncbi:MAG: 50S ribosomal protein L25 [Candidatus Zixiibacteriota bacterium]|nr:MAG: 50S ribosomal protein L25 [candidate division Zixibacteria bacterium]
MEEIRLSAEKREATGKGASRKIRVTGSIPGVLYGPDTKPVQISLDTKELAALLRRPGSSGKLINLNLGAEKRTRKVVIRELQRDPVTGDYEHVDLYQVSMKKKLNMTARVHLMGTPEGVKLGGIMQHVIREIDIACLPSNIPDRIELDVSHLVIGDSIHVSDLTVDNVDILTNPKRTIVTVVPPTVIKVEEPEVAAEEAEVEAEEVEAAEGEAKPEAEGEGKKEGKKAEDGEAKGGEAKGREGKGGGAKGREAKGGGEKK